jgi:hypothetical protein
MMGWGASKAAFVGAVAALLVVAAIALTTGADAKAVYESPYGYERTWNAALRLVRVDNGWKVSEKDDTNGYLLFEYKPPGSTKPSPGSLELVRGREPDSPVSVLVQLPQMPRYHEQIILDALALKMRREYGDAPERKRPAPPPAPPSEPVDGGEEQHD